MPCRSLSPAHGLEQFLCQVMTKGTFPRAVPRSSRGSSLLGMVSMCASVDFPTAYGTRPLSGCDICCTCNQRHIGLPALYTSPCPPRLRSPVTFCRRGTVPPAAQGTILHSWKVIPDCKNDDTLLWEQGCRASQRRYFFSLAYKVDSPRPRARAAARLSPPCAWRASRKTSCSVASSRI